MAMGFQKPYDVIPPGGGGGCMMSGPFANMTISLGPIGGVLPDVPKNPRTDGFAANKRCIRRDVNKNAAAVTFANYTYALIKNSPTIDKFQKDMLGIPEKNDWGVHMAGHYTIGGDPGGVSALLPITSQSRRASADGLIGLLLITRRPSLLVPSWHGRQNLVDLADAGSREPHGCFARDSPEG